MKLKPGEEFSPPEIMLTPLVDVILMLLTFFLLGTNFKQTQGVLESHLPKDRGPNPRNISVIEAKEELVIRCKMLPAHQYPVYQLGDVVYPTVGSLEKRLMVLHAATPGQPVTIDPDPAAPYERVLWVLNSCLKVGYSEVAFAAAIPKGPQIPGAPNRLPED